MAARYGYTVDQFYALTMRQIFYLSKSASAGHERDVEIMAKLHGLNYKPRIEVLDIPKERQDEINNHAKDVINKLKLKHIETINAKR